MVRIFCFAVLLFAATKVALGLRTIMDIGLYDEAQYLHHGVNLREGGFPAPEWAPGYVLWYYLLHLAAPDKIDLYYSNFVLLSILVPILFHLVLRSHGVSPAISFVASFLVAVSHANLFLWPRPSHFGAIILLSSILASRVLLRFGHCTSRGVICLGSLLCSYVRPEFFLSFLAFLLWDLVSLWKNRKEGRFRQLGLFYAILISATILLGSFLGIPFQDRSDRAFFAFSQHFAINCSYWENNPLNPSTNIRYFMEKSFGNSRSIREAMTANPQLFMKHLWSNLAGFPGALFETLFFHVNFLWRPDLDGTEAEGILLFILTVACVLFLGRKTEFRKIFREKMEDLGSYLILCIPPLISSIMIFPRDQYLFIPALFLTASLLILTDSTDNREVSQRSFLPPILVCVLCPSLAFPWPVSRPNLETIRVLQSLHVSEKVNLLEAEGGFDLFLENSFRRVAEYEKLEKSGFFDFLKEKKVNMILDTPNLRSDNRFVDDHEWRDFLANPKRYGFSARKIPNCDRRILFRDDLISASGTGGQ